MGASAKRAFTLIELLLVALVLTVIAGFAIPDFRRTFEEFGLRQTVNDLSYLMRYAQSRAITRNFELQIQFSDDFKEYHLMEKKVAEDGSQSAPSDFEPFAGRMGKMFYTPEDVQIKSSSSMMHFYSDGNIDPLRINICRKDKCYTISTQEQRGYVEVFAEKIE